MENSRRLGMTARPSVHNPHGKIWHLFVYSKPWRRMLLSAGRERPGWTIAEYSGHHCVPG